ncbi:MAG: bacillithiol biosynthesis cysteine-adding enzyme BshC [Ginsengibacter sp.]
MDIQFTSSYIPYSQTSKFSKTVEDYVSGKADLKDFYEHPVNLEGIKAAIAERKNFNTNRKLLVAQLNNQYDSIDNCERINANIALLLNENTFTICTAHQPNLFTGHLYFIYKILHAIKLSDTLNTQLPGYKFVPVFYMGSEDADLEELNHVEIDGESYEWKTKQTGAVGRMKIDEGLIQLIERISGRLSVEKYGKEIIDLLRYSYKLNSTIEEATFLFVHEIFKQFGLIVLLSDKAEYKNEMLSIFEDDIFNNTSSEIVKETSLKLSANYKAQAYPREINLFYLKDNIRNRIVAQNDNFLVQDTDIKFNKEEIKKELLAHPERFSPNVILRGLFQEFILPDVAWIGGGGELAYWLQLKDLFHKYKTPFPVLVLRNSFVILEKRFSDLLSKLSLNPIDLFKGETTLFNELVKKQSSLTLNLHAEKVALAAVYAQSRKIAEQIDVTLLQHTEALETKAIKGLDSLERKILRAEKRKFGDLKNQLATLSSAGFTDKSLQERTENFMLFYAKWGKDFFNIIYEHSLSLEQEFCVLEEK